MSLNKPMFTIGGTSMLQRALIAVAIIIVLFVIYRSYRAMYGREKVMSSQGNIMYSIIPDFANKAAAATLIDQTNSRIINFLAYLKHKYTINYAGVPGPAPEPTVWDKVDGAPLRYIVYRILHGYNPEVIIENDPRYSLDTSYTVNKGEKIYMCVRQKKNPKELVDSGALFFVMLHEISHIGNTNWGHGPDFWEIFKFILHEGQLSGLYRPIDYGRQPVTYCGLKVTYNPLYDAGVRKIW